MAFRRKRLPAELERPYGAFLAVVEPLERAKAALTESVPGTRLPGRPLAETLLEFEGGLREVREGMGAWRTPEVEAEWVGAGASLDEALAMAERLRLRAEMPEGFEALIGTIQDLIAPLEAFEAAEARFRALRV
jgi:hypothetical protein